MAPKRAGAKTAGRPAKKAKTEVAKDPMKEAVKSIVSAFEDDDQVGLSVVPAVTKEMLGSVITTSLGAGAAADERHEYQVKIADAIGEVLKEVITVWEGKVEEAKAGITAAEALKTEKSETSATAETTLATKSAETTAAQEKLSTAKTDLASAKTKLAECKEAVKEFDADLAKKQADLAEVKGVMTDSFEPMKAGLFNDHTGFLTKEQKASEKDKLATISGMLKTLKADSSLMSALESALTKKPDKRGQFDAMAIEQLQSILETKVKECGDIIDNADSLKAEKTGAVTDAETTLSNCEAAKTQGEADLDAAKKAEKEASASLKDAKKAVVSQEKAVGAAEETASDAEASLELAKKNVEFFDFLYSRPSVAPEPEPVAEEPPAETPAEEAPAEPMAVEEPTA
jgi:DNA repair exonuclease SbcCD ATPase subunit